jgi:hypothetical protein
MPKSKARTDDWVRLANAAVSARDNIRGAFKWSKDMRESDAGTSQEFDCIYVSRSAVREVLEHLNRAGTILSTALKERGRQ